MDSIDTPVYSPEKLFNSELQKIAGVTFTRRELDIIACILAGKKGKKIAILLSIAYKTVESHIRNIMQKLDCHSQEQIVEFIEKSEKAQRIKNFYDNLLIQINFEKILNRISQSINPNKPIKIHLLYLFQNQELIENSIFLSYLGKALKIVGINVFIREMKDLSKGLHNENKFNNQNKNLTVYSLPLKEWEEYNQLYPNTQYSLMLKKNYYWTILEILEKCFEDVNFAPYKAEFESKIKSHTLNENSRTIQNLRSIKKPAFAIFAIAFIAIFGFILASRYQLVPLDSIRHNQYLENLCTTNQFLSKQKNSIPAKERFKNGKLYSWNIPRQDHLFIPRKSILEKMNLALKLNHDVSPNQKNSNESQTILDMESRICAITGLGGIGKTELALQYLLHPNESYTFKGWFQAENLDQLNQEYIEFAKKLGYKYDEHNIGKIVAYVHQWLSDNPGWLIVYDNVDSYEKIAPYLPKNGGQILITTRSQLWPGKITVIPIELMTEAESVLLIQSFAKRNFTYQELHSIKEMAKILDYLPLALAHAGSYIHQNHMSPVEYLDLYKKHSEELLKDEMFPKTEHAKPIFITWNTSLEAISKNEKNHDNAIIAVDLLKACSYLAADKIPRSLLVSLLKEMRPTLKHPEMAISKFISLLWKYSLINIAENGDISMHRLVQLVLRHHQALEAKKDNHLSQQKLFYALFIAIHKNFKESTKIQIAEVRQLNLLPHLQAIQEHYSLLSSEFNKNKIEPYFADILLDLGDIFNRIQIPKSALIYYNQAFKIKEKQFGTNHINLAECLTKLGMIYRISGDNHQARDLFERSLQIRKQSYGSNHIELAYTLAQLGIAYKNIGEFQKAKTLQEQALTIQQQYFGKDHLEVAKTLFMLSSTYGCLVTPREQKEFAERSLKILEQYFDNDHPHIATTLMYIGNANRMLGENKQAKDFLLRSLAIREKFHGRRHPQVAQVLTLLGGVYRDLGDTIQAKKLLEESINIKEEFYGKDHFEIAKSLLELGIVYKNLGDIFQAKEFLEKALRINKQYYGSEHSEVAKVLAELKNIRLE